MTAVRGMALGRCLHRSVPEDRFDRQPLKGEDGRLLMVADVRLDNRAELLAALGNAETPDLPDSRLLFRCWSRWGEDALDRVLGDFAFAVWDSRDELLTLVRDPMGERPLHYFADPGLVAFASLPQVLSNVSGAVSGVNEGRMAEFVADLLPGGTASFFQGVSRVEPGSVVRISRSSVDARRYWHRPRQEIRYPRQEDYGEALREQLDRAVRARLRRASGGIGAHLSSGFDSGAVASSAAVQMRDGGESLHAFTSAPRAGFGGAVPAGRIADESALAAATARLHPNIEHVVVRPDGRSPLALFDADHEEAGQPVGHVFNNVWYTMIGEAARSRGVGVLLTGEAGNFSISAGIALDQLTELIRRGRILDWVKEARALGSGAHRRASILNASLSPWLPRGAYKGLRSFLQPGFTAGAEDMRFVAPHWRDEMERRSAAIGWDIRPPRDPKARRWELLQTFDPGNFRKRSLLRWGIEERDPTADRRLIEFCFSLPPEAYLQGGTSRPAMRAALAGRLPDAVMNQSLRGYQTADWYEQITGEEVRAFADSFRGHSQRVVDLDAVRQAAADWPSGGWHHRPVIYLYRSKLLRALSALHFIRAAGTGGPD